MNQNKTILAPVADNSYPSIETIMEKLKYFSQPFPQEAVEAAIKYKNEITPKLLESLDYAYECHQTLDDGYMGHLYALFLLAEFKEEQAFTLVIKILELPSSALDSLIGDILTEGYAKIITSVYNGDLAAIKNVIENPDNNLFARLAALDSLVGLVKVSVLDHKEITQYMASLFLLENFRSDPVAMGFLACTACSLQSDSLYAIVEELFKLNLIDGSIININDMENFKSNGYTNYTDDANLGYVESTIASISWWRRFNQD